MVAPAPRSDEELRAWVAGIVEREQSLKTHGRVVIIMEGGRVVRATIEKSELPPKPPE